MVSSFEVLIVMIFAFSLGAAFGWWANQDTGGG